MLRLIFHGSIIIALTLLTQIGGLAYLLACLLAYNSSHLLARWGIRLGLFVMLYGAGWWMARKVAPIYGREPLPCLADSMGDFRLQSPIYCLANRNYVTSGMKSLLLDLSMYMNQAYPGTLTQGLDAGFPFFDGFPMLPHLSHRDGNQMDLAFYYKDQKGGYLRGQTASPVGYWAFSGTGTEICPDATRWDLRWKMDWFQPMVRPYEIEEARMTAALDWLEQEGPMHGLKRILLEPDLKQRWLPHSKLIGFQGCHAARHDDHLHLSIRP